MELILLTDGAVNKLIHHLLYLKHFFSFAQIVNIINILIC